MNSLETVNLGENALEYLGTNELGEYAGQAMIEQHVISPDFCKMEMDAF